MPQYFIHFCSRLLIVQILVLVIWTPVSKQLYLAGLQSFLQKKNKIDITSRVLEKRSLSLVYLFI